MCYPLFNPKTKQYLSIAMNVSTLISLCICKGKKWIFCLVTLLSSDFWESVFCASLTIFSLTHWVSSNKFFSLFILVISDPHVQFLYHCCSFWHFKLYNDYCSFSPLYSASLAGTLLKSSIFSACVCMCLCVCVCVELKKT